MKLAHFRNIIDEVFKKGIEEGDILTTILTSSEYFAYKSIRGIQLEVQGRLRHADCKEEQKVYDAMEALDEWISIFISGEELAHYWDTILSPPETPMTIEL